MSALQKPVHKRHTTVRLLEMLAVQDTKDEDVVAENNVRGEDVAKCGICNVDLCEVKADGCEWCVCGDQGQGANS